MTLDSLALDIVERLKNREQTPHRSFAKDEAEIQHPLAFIEEQVRSAPEIFRQRLHDEFFAVGPLTNLLSDPTVSEILISPKAISFERHGTLWALDDRFLTDFSFQQFLHKVCEESGVHTSLKTPFVDGIWREFRLHLVQHPICDDRYSMSLRRQSKQLWTLESLLENNFLSQAQLGCLKEMYDGKKNILIVGTTGCGKTTLINTLIQKTLPTERLIIIEDTDEIEKPNVVSTKLLTRQKGLESLPDISLKDLLRQSLRMRPDRILVGEVRGEEAKDLLLTLSTGHSGFLGTLHARSSREALWRLEMLIQMGAPQWSLDTIRKLIRSSLHAIVVVARVEGQRKVQEICQITGLENHGFLLEPITSKD